MGRRTKVYGKTEIASVAGCAILDNNSVVSHITSMLVQDFLKVHSGRASHLLCLLLCEQVKVSSSRKISRAIGARNLFAQDVDVPTKCKYFFRTIITSDQSRNVIVLRHRVKDRKKRKVQLVR